MVRWRSPPLGHAPFRPRTVQKLCGFSEVLFPTAISRAQTLRPQPDVDIPTTRISFRMALRTSKTARRGAFPGALPRKRPNEHSTSENVGVDQWTSHPHCGWRVKMCGFAAGRLERRPSLGQPRLMLASLERDFFERSTRHDDPTRGDFNVWREFDKCYPG